MCKESTNNKITSNQLTNCDENLNEHKEKFLQRIKRETIKQAVQRYNFKKYILSLFDFPKSKESNFSTHGQNAVKT